jgi:hypothetical protein
MWPMAAVDGESVAHATTSRRGRQIKKNDYCP